MSFERASVQPGDVSGVRITPAAIRALAEQAGVNTGGALDREKARELIRYYADLTADTEDGFLDSLEACVVPDPRITRIEALANDAGYASLPSNIVAQLKAILRGDQ